MPVEHLLKLNLFLFMCKEGRKEIILVIILVGYLLQLQVSMYMLEISISVYMCMEGRMEGRQDIILVDYLIIDTDFCWYVRDKDYCAYVKGRR